MEKKSFLSLAGLLIGAANGFFGSGGGIIAVPMLKKYGLEVKQAHASSLAIMLPLSALSAFMYAIKGGVDYKNTLILIPFGIAGAFLGTRLMKKISSRWLSVAFGVLLVFSGGRNIVEWIF